MFLSPHIQANYPTPVTLHQFRDVICRTWTHTSVKKDSGLGIWDQDWSSANCLMTFEFSSWRTEILRRSAAIDKLWDVALSLCPDQWVITPTFLFEVRSLESMYRFLGKGWVKIVNKEYHTAEVESVMLWLCQVPTIVCCSRSRSSCQLLYFGYIYNFLKLKCKRHWLRDVSNLHTLNPRMTMVRVRLQFICSR